MRLIDEEYTAHPFKGRRKMTLHLRKQGYLVNIKRVRRLMQIMGLEAIYPQPRTTIVDQEHRVYPYLLRGVPIVRLNRFCQIECVKDLNSKEKANKDESVRSGNQRDNRVRAQSSSRMGEVGVNCGSMQLSPLSPPAGKPQRITRGIKAESAPQSG